MRSNCTHFHIVYPWLVPQLEHVADSYFTLEGGEWVWLYCSAMIGYLYYLVYGSKVSVEEQFVGQVWVIYNYVYL